MWDELSILSSYSCFLYLGMCNIYLYNLNFSFLYTRRCVCVCVCTTRGPHAASTLQNVAKDKQR